MHKTFTMSLGLSSNQFHAGLLEIGRQFEALRSDEYLNGLVGELATTNEALLDAMHIAKVKHNVKQENRQLTECLASASRYIDSCLYVSDDAVRESAAVLKQLWGSYGKPFTRMKLDERIGAVITLLRDLALPGIQEHVVQLPELEGRIATLQAALNALKRAVHEVDKANGLAPKGQPLMPLKREAAAKVESLVDYLKAMALKDPAAYGDHYEVVKEIITRLNTRRRKNLQVAVELADEEATTEEPKLAVGA